MKLTPPSFLMLGMVRLGARSGYAIKKATDASTRFFWPTSLAQVYPQLAQLEQAGLLVRHDDRHGSRRRSAYTLTDAGQAALLAWLRSPLEGETHFRDEGVLRMFLADALPAEDRLALLGRMRERAKRSGEQIREQILPLAQGLEAEGMQCPALVARFGADTYAYAERWLAHAEEQMRTAEGLGDPVGERTPAAGPADGHLR